MIPKIPEDKKKHKYASLSTYTINVRKLQILSIDYKFISTNP